MCMIGSAMLQNSSPVPTAALNSMANQEKLLNSGRSSSRPRRKLPKRLRPTQKVKNSTMLTTAT
ncbi:hypothetical protein D3C72_2451070 [compost metagenome]